MYEHLTNEEIETGIAAINQEMKGPMSNGQRQLLYFDRKDLRGELDRRLKTKPAELNAQGKGGE